MNIENSVRALRAYLVHAYTATGVVLAFVSVAEITKSSPDPRWVFLWLALAFVVDSTDGPLARAWEVRRYAPRIDGRTLDDIVDYLTYTFIPLLLIWRMSWVAAPAGLWIGIALVASLFGFANTQAKQEEDGSFLGFPSYWNVVAFYVGILAARSGVVLGTFIVVALAGLTLVPFPFVYPNQAPPIWRWTLAVTGVLWLALILTMLRSYPHVPGAALWLSLAYPALHVVASFQMVREAPSRSQGS